MASVHIERAPGATTQSSSRTRIMRYNDGDPTVYGERESTSNRVVGRHSPKAANPNLLRHESVGKTRSKKANVKITTRKYPTPKKKKK